MTETRWIIGAVIDPAQGDPTPQKTDIFEEAEAQGWEPAGPSVPVPTPDVVLIFLLMKRPKLQLGLLQGFEEGRS